MVRNQKYVSRLERKANKQQWRLAFFWILLSGGLIIALFVWGVPLFIEFAGWYGDYRAGDSPIAVDDNLPPAPPNISLPFTATNSATLDINGFAEQGSKVTVYLNEEEIKEVVAQSDGRFLVSDVNLEKGFNLVWAVAVDEARNRSIDSRKMQVVYDNQPPELTIEKPQSGSQFYGSGERRQEVKGTTDVDARVVVNDRSVIVDNKGSFSTFLNLDEGEQVITVKARDVAGNETINEISVNYSL